MQTYVQANMSQFNALQQTRRMLPGGKFIGDAMINDALKEYALG